MPKKKKILSVVSLLTFVQTLASCEPTVINPNTSNSSNVSDNQTTDSSNSSETSSPSTSVNNKYRVLFINDNGERLSLTSSNENGKVVYTGEEPTKKADGKNIYTFDGWYIEGGDGRIYSSEELPLIDKDVVFVAHYYTIGQTYRVRFERDDHTLIEEREFKEGEKAIPSNLTPSKESDVQYNYTFKGWNKEFTKVTENTTYVANYDKTVRNYTLTFLNGDGSVLGTKTYAYGSFGIEVETLGFTPVKGNSVYKEYRFNNVWKNRDTNEIFNVNTIIRGDCTFVPQFGENIKTYKAEFKFEDGTLISSIGNNGRLTYKYGDQITDILNPVIENTAEYEYEFLGWDKNPNGTQVTSDIVFTAKFKKTKRQYTVKFLNYDGTTALETKKVEYGKNPTYTKATPTKPSTNDNVYTFSKWQNIATNEVVDGSSLPIVTGDVTYRPLFDDETRYFTITFDIDGVITKKTYRHGDIPTIATPTKNSTVDKTYKFIGWESGEITAVDGDKTYKAVFESKTRKYTVTYVVNGSIIHSEQVEYGSPSTYNELPTKEQDQEKTYSFEGWKNDLNQLVTPGTAQIKGDTIYTASFKETPRQYTVIFLDDNGNKLKESNYAYGSQITDAPTGLTKQSDEQYTYTFKGWDKTVGKVTGNEIFTAVYDKTVRKYTIKFVDGDGKQLGSSQTLEYGSNVTYTGVTPTKTSNSQNSYKFIGWSPELTTVTGNTTYVAQFEEVARTYTVRFVNYDGTVLQIDELKYGETPSYIKANPTKPKDDKYEYTFSGWDFSIAPVTGDITYTAQYKSNAATITAKYRVDNTIIATIVFNSNETPSWNRENPTKLSDNLYNYTFKSWVKSSESTANEYIYDAEFTKTDRLYTIQFINDDGSLLSSSQLKWNSTVTAPSNPTKVSTIQYNYTFKGWNNTITNVKGDATYKATYNEILRKYTINFLDGDNKVIQSTTVEYGKLPSYTGDTPTKTSDVDISYTFANTWVPQISPVTGNASYKAEFSTNVRKYTVKFANEDGTVLQTSQVGYGVTPEYKGSTPLKESTQQYDYKFNLWDKTISGVTGDITYTAKYTSILRSYKVTLKRDDGTVIQEETVKYGEKPTYNQTPTKATDSEFRYIFSKWKDDIKPSETVIHEDTEFVAIFTAIDITVAQITFLNDDGTVFKVITAKIGQKLVMNDKPTKTSQVVGMVYTFTGWSPEGDAPAFGAAVQGEATYKANFSSEYKKYTVSFTDEQGNKLNNVDPIEITHGSKLVLPDSIKNPTKPSTAQYEYLTGFWTMNGERLPDGQKPSDFTITADTVFMYTFIATVRSYNITFVVEGVSKVGLFEYGSTPIYDGVPFKKTSNDLLYEYEFLGWTPEVKTVTGEATYTAKFSELKKKLGKVTFIVDGKTYVEENVEFGSKIFSLKPKFETDKKSDDPKLYSWIYKGMFVDGLETNEKLTEDTELYSKEITFIAYWEKSTSKYHIVFAKSEEDRTPIDSSDEKYDQYVTYQETIQAPNFDYVETDKLGIITKDSSGWQFAVKPLGSSVYRYQRITSFENLTYDNIKEYQHLNSADVDFLIIPYFESSDKNKYDNKNDYIKLGYYPQQLISDEELITEFNKVVEGDETSTAAYNKELDYYYLKSNPDIKYARRVYEGKEGSEITISTYDKDGSKINVSLKTGQSYYFKIEAVTWSRRVSSFTNNKPILIANSVLDYTTYIDYSTLKAKNKEEWDGWFSSNFPVLSYTNYSTSYLRSFLNDKFYKELFKFDDENDVNKQQNYVGVTSVSNSLESAGVNVITGEKIDHNYDEFFDFNSTDDKFFALSYQELNKLNNFYYEDSGDFSNWATRNFVYSSQLTDETDSSKFFNPTYTDYAKFTYFSSYKGTSSNLCYFTRSPSVRYTNYGSFSLYGWRLMVVNTMLNVFRLNKAEYGVLDCPTKVDEDGYLPVDLSSYAYGVLPAFSPTCAFWSEVSGNKAPWIEYK